MPNEKHTLACDRNNFNEWFNLARAQGLVMGSMKGNDGNLYVFTRDGERFPFEQMLDEHPLDILSRNLESSTL